MDFTRSFSNLEKVKTAFFCGKVAPAQEKLRDIGIDEAEWPEIIIQTEPFLKFICS